MDAFTPWKGYYNITYDIPEFVSHAQLHGLTAKNIVFGFQRTGIYPFNRDVFYETEFEPAAVTDRDLQSSSPSNENLSPGAESTDNFNVVQNSSALFGAQKEINEESLLNNSFTQEALSFINVASTSAGPRGVYISLADIISLPRAGQRRVSKKGRKKGDTRILTNSPVRNSIAEGFTAKKRKKEEVQGKAKKTLFRSGFRRKNHLLHPRKVMGLWSLQKRLILMLVTMKNL